MEVSALSVHQAVRRTRRVLDDPEAALVARFAQNVAGVVDLTDDAMPASFYVALKTKPFAILTGPAGSGKHDLVQLFGQMVSGGDPLRFQEMLGHAWWAGRTRNCALYAEAQQRLNDDKLLELVHAALEADNASRLYIACLARISPAEVAGLFSLLARQKRHGELIRLPTRHLGAPVPYPANVRVIGTLTEALRTPVCADILASVTLINWAERDAPKQQSAGQRVPYGCEELFLESCVDSRGAALSRLSATGDVLPALVGLLWSLIRRLERHHFAPAGDVINDVLKYVANAWSQRGAGLFSQQAGTNLVTALDFALCYYLVPRMEQTLLAQPALRADLLEWCAGRYPRLMQSLRRVG